ncbi:hypothetical protein CLOM_g13206 [Closterium sp. NIES-68]|nr:hypothetical protein CLOM_g13206 [Closterium sp. NIES-68]GJP76151.1 hypothetical protein CLOP_g6524 [Closterium sp. NIES-67]
MADTAWRLAAQEDGERVRKLQASLVSLTAEVDAAAAQVDRIQHLLRQVDSASKALATATNPAISTFGTGTDALALLPVGAAPAAAAAGGEESFRLSSNNPFAPEHPPAAAAAALEQSFSSFSFSHPSAAEIDLEEALGLKPKPPPAAAAAAAAAHGGSDLALSPSFHDDPSSLFPSSLNINTLPPPPGARAAAAAAATPIAAAAAGGTEAERRAQESGKKKEPEAGQDEKEKRQQQEQEEQGARKVRFDKGVKDEDGGRETGTGRTGGSSGGSGRRREGGARGMRGMVPQMHVPSPDSEIVQFSTFSSFAGQRPLLHVTPKGGHGHGHGHGRRDHGPQQQEQQRQQGRESGSGGKGTGKGLAEDGGARGEREGARAAVNGGPELAAKADVTGAAATAAAGGGASRGGSSSKRRPSWMKAPAASTELSTFPMSAVFRNPPPVVAAAPATAPATATAAATN